MPLAHRRLLLMSVCVSALLSLCAVSAAAAAPRLELTVGSEPVESVATQFGGVVSGATKGDGLWVTIQPAGGERCAANPITDHGNNVIEAYLTETGPFTASHNYTFQTAGSYILCGWVTGTEGYEHAVAAAEKPVTVRQPHLTLSVYAPAGVSPGQTFQITTTAQTETTRAVWEYLLPSTGDGCAANAQAASEAAGVMELIGYWNVIGGPSIETKNETLTAPGIYEVCAYIEYPGRESPPEATAVTQMEVVPPPPQAPPPPPCVVPVVKRRSTLARVERQLTAAHCTLAIRHLHSRRVPRGRVIGLTLRAHTRLAPNARVTVLVSSGRRR